MAKFEFKKKFDRSQLVVGGVALAMLACFVAIVCVPNARALSRAAADLEAAEQLLSTKMNEVKELPEVAGTVARMKQQRDREMAKVPCESRLPEFLKTVADILRSESIAERELVPQRPKDVRIEIEWVGPATGGAPRKETLAVGYTELPINIMFQAPFAAAFRVLSKLERLARINHVETLKLSAVPRGAPGRLLVEVQVVIYHHSEKDDALAAAGEDREAGRT